MQKATLEFDHNARTVYTAVRHLFRTCSTQFSGLDFNDGLLIVEARHGMFLSPFSERIKIKVVATSTSTCKVVVESTSRSMLNLLNFGANSDNVSDLCDYINNEVYRLMHTEDPRTWRDGNGIKFKENNIKFK